jgi:hypothetical protein
VPQRDDPHHAETHDANRGRHGGRLGTLGTAGAAAGLSTAGAAGAVAGPTAAAVRLPAATAYVANARSDTRAASPAS